MLVAETIFLQRIFCWIIMAHQVVGFFSRPMHLLLPQSKNLAGISNFRLGGLVLRGGMLYMLV